MSTKKTRIGKYNKSKALKFILKDTFRNLQRKILKKSKANKRKKAKNWEKELDKDIDIKRVRERGSDR